MDQTTIRQQIADKIKQSSNLLVTVSNKPSVDQLAACIGLTLLLNKMDKHATAVFSGPVPSTIEFLKPEKTLEKTTDSLRDFIVALDKNKADKLYFKVEGDLVKIFITPYHASLTQSDLSYSQGDYNVDVVLALGVKSKEEVDQAIVAHGKILHDATVISFNSGAGNAPEVGQMNWQDPSASGICEMIVSMAEAFGTGLMDNQMATAFLTGIVSETARFSNPKTTPRVMTLSAQLMAAGANQQLIAKELQATLQTGIPQVAMPKDQSAPQQVMAIKHDLPQPIVGELPVPAAIPMPQPTTSTAPTAEILAAEPVTSEQPVPAPIPMPEAPTEVKTEISAPEPLTPIGSSPSTDDINIDENGNVISATTGPSSNPMAPIGPTTPEATEAIPMPTAPPSEAGRSLLPMDSTPETGSALNSNLSDSDSNENYDPMAPKKGTLLDRNSAPANSQDTAPAPVEQARSLVEQIAQPVAEQPKPEKVAAQLWGMPEATPQPEQKSNPDQPASTIDNSTPPAETGMNATSDQKIAPPPLPPPLT